MGLLSDKELEQLVPADQVDNGTPIPTRLVSSDEYLPIRQTERQKQVLLEIYESVRRENAARSATQAEPDPHTEEKSNADHR